MFPWNTQLARIHRVGSPRATSLTIVAIAFLHGVSALGQSPPGMDAPQEPKLESFLRVASVESPQLKAAYEDWMAELAAVGRARGWPDPQLSYSGYLRSVETALGPQQHALALRQRVPWFGKLSLGGDAASQAAAAAEQRFVATRLALHRRVAGAYYEYAYLARAIAITEENLQLFLYQESVARARYRTDSTSYAEVVRLQVELGILEDRLRSLEEQRAASSARLNANLGHRSDATLPWPVPLSDPLFEIPSDEAVLSAVRANNPRLLALAHEVESADRLSALARRNRYPDLTLGVQTILTGTSELTSFDDDGRDAWIATLSLEIPLWRGKYDAAIREADARRRSVEYTRDDSNNQLAADTRQVLFELRDAERKIDLYASSLLPKAEQVLQATATEFATGKKSFLDFMDAQRTLLRFELELARARADRGKLVIEVAELMGTAPVEESETPGGQS